ncbi:prepilin peptidase [Proteiniclasticum sp. SCR006]|uniref:Prepilin peptidase n=1 Tax=Proteiniclasticum aestuarii TaxID=2817862 RepID=A0A939HA81_9CLOT|nr:prepilin peptidase [Proteiniclasticum aestuarii]
MGLLYVVYGLIIGSFLNVVIYRIPAGISIAYPPSTCGSCGKRIRAYHLVPVFSYLLLKGRCGYCREKISARYPLIEGLNGFLYLMLYQKIGFGIESVLLCLFSSVLIVVGMIDYDTMDVYLSTLVPGAILVVFILLERTYRGISILPFILAGLIAMILIFLVIQITKGGMGIGDIWILGLIGIVLGPVLTLVSFFLTSVIGGGVASFLLASKKKNGKEGIPFGPLLIIGFFMALLFGQELLDFYFSLFSF